MPKMIEDWRRGRRLRRLRMTAPLRELVQETRIEAADLIYPLFVVEGTGIRREVASMPGVFNFSVDELEREAGELAAIGVRAVLLFGIPGHKDETGSAACDPGGVVQRAVAAIKRCAPQVVAVTDVCLCEYTSHGHCGIAEGGRILNDPTVELLARMAVSHAQAGADMVAPSDMMDLRVSAIRQALDEAGFPETPIMSYSAKYASAFYGPFRDAAKSAPAFGGRNSHQLDPANAREALLEAETDIAEGADIVMVKPALCYLDILRRLRERHDIPLAAYNVSGEYSMVKAAAARGWIDEARAIQEMLLSIKRAGADLIITYFAKDYLSSKAR